MPTPAPDSLKKTLSLKMELKKRRFANQILRTELGRQNKTQEKLRIRSLCRLNCWKRIGVLMMS